MNVKKTLVAGISAGLILSGCNLEQVRKGPPNLIVPLELDEYENFICNPYSHGYFETDQIPILTRTNIVTRETRLNAVRNFQLITQTNFSKVISETTMKGVLRNILEQFRGTDVELDLVRLLARMDNVRIVPSSPLNTRITSVIFSNMVKILVACPQNVSIMPEP